MQNLGMRRKIQQLRSIRFAVSRRRKHLRSRRATEELCRRMKEIGKDQERTRKGQREVRENFERIELECEQLRKETNLITQQNLSTQLRLCLVFQILKARENNDFTKAAGLTQILRLVP